jgi:hypothetical protein
MTEYVTVVAPSIGRDRAAMAREGGALRAARRDLSASNVDGSAANPSFSHDQSDFSEEAVAAAMM